PSDWETGDHDITPICDPRSGTTLQRAMKAQKYAALRGDPMINQNEVLKRYLNEEGFENPETMIATPDQRLAQIQERRMMIELEMAELELAEKRGMIANKAVDTDLKGAKVAEVEAKTEATQMHTALAPVEMQDRLENSDTHRHAEISKVLGKSPEV
ncbi:MAG: hypothetical protein VXW22_16245, partial [Pseudomonadota bacterium]|nr:hypothetical protein [Pseudomonadota bacterium]